MVASALAQAAGPGIPQVTRRSDSGFFILPVVALADRGESSGSQKRMISFSGLLNLVPLLRRPRWGEERGRPSIIRVLALCLLFLISFAGPLLVAANFLGAFSAARSPQPGSDELFSASLVADGRETRVEFGPDTELQPTADHDFLVVSWFKFKKLPAVGERMLLFSKSEPGSKLQTGYALMLVGDAEGPRPFVFLGGSAGGKLYRFTDLKVPTQQWVMFALSIREGRFLGLHIASVSEPGRSDIRLLGGYDLETPPELSNQQPLVVAPSGMMRFSGRIGPVGVFQKKDLGAEFRELLKGLSRTPEESMELFHRKEVALWWMGGDTDLSRHQQKVSVFGVAPRKAKP